MKNGLRRGIAIGLVLMLTVALLPGIAGAENWKLEDARSMLSLINSFRTSGSAWYWNEDNTTWTTVTGLGRLAYDYELEKVAKVRAAEQAQREGHTRPNGSKWSTAFPSGNYAKGENIAIGYTTAAAAFEGLKEENDDYEGQGHRRNMLNSRFTRVGIAGVEINGEIYWVQEFANGAVVSSSPQEDVTAGWVKDGGKYYYRYADGSWAKGWLQDGGNWYYMNNQAVMQTGWQKIGGQWYYFTSSGEMVTGTVTIDGQREIFGGDGTWQGSEISGYDTPLGGNDLIRFIRKMIMMLWESIS